MQPLMTTFVHHSVRKGGGVAALKMAKNDFFGVTYSDQGGGGGLQPPQRTLPLYPPMIWAWLNM